MPMTPLEELDFVLHTSLDQSFADAKDHQRIDQEYVRPLRAIGAEAFERIASTLQSPLLSAAGKAQTLDRLRRQTHEKFLPYVKRVTETQERKVELRQRLIHGLEPTRDGGWVRRKETPKTLEMVFRECLRDWEIRTRFLELPQHERDELYLTAKANDSDPELVHAIEDAPRAFAIVRTTAREAAERLELEKSPFKPQLDALEQEAAALAYIVERAEKSIDGAIETQLRRLRVVG